MAKRILYHGTSKENAERIMRKGFKPDLKHNWNIKSKRGFVYLSSAYAPFYVMATKGGSVKALIKVEIEEKDIYPEDDFIMYGLGKPRYTQRELNMIDLEKYKHLAKKSLEYMGNVAVKPDKIKILGVRYFDSKHLIIKCDPVISPLNFRIMGDYYRKLSDWIYDGKDIMEFPNFMNIGFNEGGIK